MTVIGTRVSEIVTVVDARLLCRIMNGRTFMSHLERLRALYLLHLPHEGWNQAHILSTANLFDIDNLI